MQTLTIREAETQLQALVNQTQFTHQPVILTNEETATPVAVLMESEQYAASFMMPELVLSTRLNKLFELLSTLDTQWNKEMIRQAFPSAWRWHLEGIWEGSRQREAPFRQLVVLLQMAARQLQMTEFTRAHLALLHSCCQVLRQSTVRLEDLARCDRALIQLGFPVLLEFSDEMIAHYVEES